MKKRLLLVLICVILLGAAGVTAWMVPASRKLLQVQIGGENEYEDKVMSAWMKDLSSEDPEVRSKAAFVMGQMAPDSKEAIPRLCELVRDNDTYVRIHAMMAIYKMRKEGKPAVPTMIAALKDDNEKVRMNATMALLQLGQDAKAAIPALLEGVREDRNRVYIPRLYNTIREMMVLALGFASSGTEDAVPALMDLLRDPEASMRAAAAKALGHVGPHAKPAVDSLLAVLHDQGEEVRDHAANALLEIDPEAAAKAGLRK